MSTNKIFIIVANHPCFLCICFDDESNNYKTNMFEMLVQINQQRLIQINYKDLHNDKINLKQFK